jgi:hypothetical protein
MQGRLLVAYSNASNFVSTTVEYLESFSKYCNMEVRYAHVTNGAKLDFDLNDFDAVFQSYCVRLPVDNYISADFIEKLRSFRGIKMLAAQDEYENTNKLKSGMQAIGFHVFLTNAAGSMIEQLYPREEFPNTEFVTVLTGYVPEQFEVQGRASTPLRERSIHIGYRCRQLPAYYGRLGFDKFEIGRRMKEVCIANGIPHDIEWTNDKRLYGDAWYDFIGSCRANLGSETCYNVFDFDGTLREKYEILSVARGAPVPFEEFRTHTDPIEAKYDIGQISPRIFEAAAMRTPLILFSGRYLGLISPNEHYIELKKDFSNVDAVLRRLQDVEALERMADRAYDRLVASGEFSYRRFVQLVEDTIRRKAAELGVPLRPPTGEFGPTEFGVLLARLTEFREAPTVAPRHPAFFLYQDLAKQNAYLTKELERQNGYYSAELDRVNTYYNERIGYLNGYIAEQNDTLSKEIARLNQYYPDRIAYLNSYIKQQGEELTCEINRLNEYYPKQIGQLNAYIVRQNEEFEKEIARLNEFHATRIDQLKGMIAAKNAKSFGISARGDSERLPQAVASGIRKLVVNSHLRGVGRKVIARLPEWLGQRIKSRVGLLIDRL